MRIAVIGCGRMGTQRIRDLLALDERDLLIHDTDWDRQFYAGIDPCIRAYRDLATLWDKEPDCVLICTPPDSHLPLALEAAAHGARAIFVEKPLALEMPTPEQLAALSGCVTMVGANLRYTEHALTMKAALDSGRLGRPLSATLRASYYLPAVRPDYRTSYAAEVGALMDVGWHLVDLALDWLGPACFGSVLSFPADAIGLPDVDGAAYLTLGHASGCVTSIDVDFTRPGYDLSWAVNGSEGSAVFAYDCTPDAMMFTRELVDFLQCAREGKPTVNPIERAVDTLRILLEAKGQWQSGR